MSILSQSIMRRFLLSITGCFSVVTGFAQAPSADFDPPGVVCRGETIVLQNSSSNASNYAWDLCEGDLQGAPVATTLTEQDFNVPVGTSLIKTNGLWYGFVTSLNNSSIFRLDFGASLLNPSPVVTNLGNLGGLVNQPQNIKAIAFANKYYLFVNNRGSNRLIRIDLGIDIEAISATSDIIANGGGYINGGMDVVFDGTNWIAFLTNAASITRILIGNNIDNIPVSSDVQNLPAIPEISNI